MKKTILHDGCRFSCNRCLQPLSIQAAGDIRTHASDGGHKLLTTDSKLLKGVGICQPLTAAAGGTAAPCMLPPVVQWQGTDKKMKINGSPVLTEKSFCICPVPGGRGTIKPQRCSGKIADVTQLNPPVPAPAPISAAGVNADSDIRQSSEPMPAAVQRERETYRETESPSIDGKDQETYHAVPQSSPQDPYAACHYQNCSRRDSCAYFLAEPEINNDSAKLKRNLDRLPESVRYQEKHREKNAESSEGNWRIAAHHILPGNQLLLAQEPDGSLRYGVLVKLASFFGYDVNCAENGILLPTNENKFGDNEKIIKLANAYTAMWMMGRQWHVGGHSYPVSEDTLEYIRQYCEKHPDLCRGLAGSPRFFDCYIEMVKGELDQLRACYSRKRCWLRDQPRRKEKFLSDMAAVSGRVGRFLLAFERDPRASFPFYVSNTAVEYSFHIPAAVQVIAVCQGADGCLWAKKFRMERFRKDNLECILKKKEECLLREDNILEFIAFCGNIRHFLIQKDTGYTLPFSSSALGGHWVRELDCAGMDVSDCLKNHANEIMAFAGGTGAAYVPPAAAVRARRKEIL